MQTPLSKTLKNFFSFISLFIGTGFIAGSIVHFGEGVTIWDSSVLILGIVLFVGASFVQEYGKHQQRSTPATFMLFLFQSLLLAIGIGMASGGTQHFIDTPTYSAILIPLGLSIGLFAFFWREKLVLAKLKWLSLLIGVVVIATILWVGLVSVNTIIPDRLRVGHGSHGHNSTEEFSTIENAPLEDHFDEEHLDDGHGH